MSQEREAEESSVPGVICVGVLRGWVTSDWPLRAAKYMILIPRK